MLYILGPANKKQIACGEAENFNLKNDMRRPIDMDLKLANITLSV
jgi:hypothetical protein